MTTRLIKRDTNWEVYQNGSLVASTFNTDLPTITFSDEVAKELGIVDISKKAIEYCKKRFNNQDWEEHYYTYVDSYNQFLSDNADKRFTLEDILLIINEIGFVKTTPDELNSKEYQPFITDEDEQVWTINKEHLLKYTQYLTKEEYFCELEMEEKCCGLLSGMIKGSDLTESCKFCSCRGNTQPKITNNSCKVIKIWK